TRTRRQESCRNEVSTVVSPTARSRSANSAALHASTTTRYRRAIAGDGCCTSGHSLNTTVAGAATPDRELDCWEASFMEATSQAGRRECDLRRPHQRYRSSEVSLIP